ncbi:multiubiquitin domain-containing protein [uncultured Deinococcus sp.]|uniref:multiubiquitin domain-containing protein n=1 Tax=uncultured Deinococcus sp. TaxID=158789 RepID=UPI0025F77206|nr:multiubiquitin domain-containing protein [uncultured Deinococcus sp.]
MTDLSTHRQEDHGHEKLLTIIVNGRERQVTSKELTYEEVVRLAYDNPPTGPNVLITVTYRRGHGEKPEGSLTEGASVRVKEGMIFNVAHTDKS